MYVHLKLKVK